MKQTQSLKQLLSIFYKENGIPENGGVDDKTFTFKVFRIPFKLPNPKFRREALHIHDIQHVLNNQDTSWKGEGFIAGWEIATGMWKNLRLGGLSLWAMGYSFWIYPNSVLKGYKKGLNEIGIIDLNKSKSEFMEMNYAELLILTKKEVANQNKITFWTIFIFWIVVSQLIFLFPLLILMIAVTAIL